MKRFEIITEIEARALDRGETILLSRNGHVTPLALDTLKERRVTMVREGRVSAAEASLAPPDRIESIALRRTLIGFLRGLGLAVSDLGTDSVGPVDYPDVAALVARGVARGEAQAGIVIDGAGIGSAIAANKIDGIRAAMASSEGVARYAREHNGVNVLTLGATLVSADEARAIVSAWLGAVMREPRHIRRLTKIRDLETMNKSELKSEE